MKTERPDQLLAPVQKQGL